MINLCAPAIIYLIFSITQILIDLYKGMYNTVVVKSIVTVMVTLLLNILCKQGLGFVSWIIVFIPFILMTVVVSAILYYFGLDAAKGKINQNKNINENDVKYDVNGNILIYDPEYNPAINPVYYQSPNIVVPNPHLNDPKPVSSDKPTTNYEQVPTGSSSPAYQS